MPDKSKSRQAARLALSNLPLKQNSETTTVMPYRKNIIGNRFGKLVVKDRIPSVVSPKGHRYQLTLCVCDCGREKIIRLSNLNSGNVNSCGCFHGTKHGHTRGSHGHPRQSPTYQTWVNMIVRCENEHHRKYHLYGGRGIKVCQQWRESFEAFLADMGERPPGKTIDRKNPDGDYDKSNCRWATWLEQQRNRRNNRRLTFSGETLCLVEWAEKTGISEATLYSRLKAGWTAEQSLTLPNSRGRRIVKLTTCQPTDKALQEG